MIALLAAVALAGPRCERRPVRRVPILLLALLWMAGPAWAVDPPWGDLPEDPEAAAGIVDQRVIPALEARAEAAQRKIEAREAYFAGESELARAFPELADTALDQPAVLRGRLAALDARAEKRAALRVVPRAEVRGAALDAALQAAFDAEERADALERRLLLGLRAHLAAHPALRAQALAPLRERLDAAVDEAAEAALEADPDDQEPARRAAALDAERARLEAIVRALWRAGTVPGADPPDPAPEIEALGDPWRAPWAAERLELLRPFLAPDERAAADAAEQRWLEEARLPELEAALQEVTIGETDPATLEAQIESLRSKVERLEEREADAPEAGDGASSLATARRRVAAAELALARARLEAGQGALGRLRQEGTADEQAGRAREEATQAMADAERARDEARGEAEVRAARVKTKAAEAQQTTAEAWEEVRASQAAWAERVEQRATTLADLRAQAADLDVALGLGQSAADALYRDVRRFRATVRSDIGEAEERLLEAQEALRTTRARATAAASEVAEARASAQELPDPGAAASEQAVDRWEEALADRVRAREQGVATARAAHDDLLGMLYAVRELRRALLGQVSRAEREADRGALLRDLGHELTLLGPQVVAQSRERLATISRLPGRLLDFNFVSALVRSSFFTLLALLGWWFAHRRAGAVSLWLLERYRRWDQRVRPVELHALRAPLERLVRSGTDVALGLLLLDPVSRLAAELGFLLTVYLYVVTLRLALATYDLLFVKFPQERPGLRVLAPGAWQLGRRTVRWLLLWWLSRRFVHYVLYDLLGVDILDAVVRLAFGVAGVGIVLVLLHLWEPLLRKRMERMHVGGWVRVLASEPPHASLRALHAAGILVYLAGAGAFALLDRLAREREGLGRLLNVVSRYRLRDEESEEPAPLPDELFQALTDTTGSHGPRVVREEVEGGLVRQLEVWQRERRQGLVLLTGDRGSGKSTELDTFCAQAAKGSSLDQHRVALGRRATRSEDVLRWLAEAFGLEETPADADQAIRALQALPPAVCVIEDVHNAFLRTVGGFEGLRTLLYVFSACGQQHLWVLSMHQPAWRYLSRIPNLVGTEVFRAVIEIPPLREAGLEELITRRLQALGYRADYQRLVRSNPFGADPEVERERAKGVFFRLLAESSAGNPSVAIDLFARCVSPGGEERVLEVHPGKVTAMGVLQGLTEADLFVLVALRIQEHLDESELVAVTNMGTAEVKSTVKHLQQRALLEVDGRTVRIDEPQLPAVTRTLRRHHFLHV